MKDFIIKRYWNAVNSRNSIRNKLQEIKYPKMLNNRLAINERLSLENDYNRICNKVVDMEEKYFNIIFN